MVKICGLKPHPPPPPQPFPHQLGGGGGILKWAPHYPPPPSMRRGSVIDDFALFSTLLHVTTRSHNISTKTCENKNNFVIFGKMHLVIRKDLERTPHFGSTPSPLGENTKIMATLPSLLLFLLSEWQVEDLHILVSRAEQRDKGRIFFHDAYTDEKRRVYKCMTICMTSCGLWCMKAV